MIEGLEAEVTPMSASTHMEEHGATDDVHVEAEPGREGVIEFVPREKGTYTIVCTVPGHREGGMTGTLAVQ